MTIIRQWAVTNSTLGNMRRLMNEDERILIRGCRIRSHIYRRKKCGGNAISATGHIERPCGICFVMREIVLIATTGRYWKAITIWRPCSQTSQHSGILTEMEIYCHRLYWLEAIKASGGNARRVVMSGAVG